MSALPLTSHWTATTQPWTTNAPVKHLEVITKMTPLICRNPNLRWRIPLLTLHLSSTSLNFTQTSKHPSFVERVTRAAKTLALKKTTRPHDEASLAIEENAHVQEMDREIAAEIVRDVRRHVEAMDGSCAVCYTLCGITDQTHRPGSKCPRMALEGESWEAFRPEIPRGTSCYKCYLPTVS